jgi:hypothetical protein
LQVGDLHAKARAFKHILLRAVPISHKAQKSAWMDHELFQQWFFDMLIPKTFKFLKEKNILPEALLISDNEPLHPNEELINDSICTLFFPPSVTSL